MPAKTEEQLEWERQLGAARKRAAGGAVRIVVAITLAALTTGGVFYWELHGEQEREDLRRARTERREKAEAELRSQGITRVDLRSNEERYEAAWNGTRFARRQKMMGGIGEMVLPFAVGTATFVAVFLLLGGRLSEEHKRGLKGLLGIRND